MDLEHRRVVVAISFFFCGLALLGWLQPAGGSAPSNPEIRRAGPVSVVFDWSREACAPTQEPDLPARAFRDHAGRVQLLISHFDNYRMVGPTLARIHTDCRPLLLSPEDPNPRRYEDRRWLASPFTYDGTHVWALVHEEYQGNHHRGRCPEHAYYRCWYNAITLAESSDGGSSYHQLPPPRQLVAGPPYRYRHGTGPVGVFAPSNLVSKARYLYALVRVRDPSRPSGDCLIRTRDIARPGAWRAWDGEAFRIAFSDPYTAEARPYVGCKPVSPGEISEMTESLTFNTALDRYLLIGIAGPVEGRPDRRERGIYFSLSDDLIHWSPRKLILSSPTLHSYRCGGPSPIAYPSLIDPGSRSRTFGTTGAHPYLYYTQFHYRACRQTANRDLMRVRLDVSD
jgi:hypothetical protein